MDEHVLSETAKALVAPGKGILAADESTGTIKKRFDKIGVDSTPENHRIYRQLLFTTDGVEKFISGVILFDETIRQNADDGKPLPQVLSEKRILPGIKVDKGKLEMPNFPGEKVTEGLDGLRSRIVEYRELGAKFAKWRAAFYIGEGTPSGTCVDSNADSLARYAAICQVENVVPIVEPEVLMEGGHDIKKAEEVTYKVLKVVFKHLSAHKIYFPGMLLKPNWVHSGYDADEKASNKEVAEATLRVLREAVPSEVPGIVFLSGGDTPEESTGHLDLMNEMDDVPWQLSFSFGRALQQPVLDAWQGKSENVEEAQKEFYERAKLNSLARTGEYDASME
jgi:fructose-bisphosphate aldolase class I